MDWSILIAESGSSQHGYDYPERALREAIPLYAGRPVGAHPYRVNHGKVEFQHLPESESHMAPYLVREMIGTIDEPWWCDGAILARLRLLPSCPISDADLHGYGLSHQVHAQVVRDAEKHPIAVHKIGAVESVDLVVTPALGGRILGPWITRAEAERWHRAERAMVHFEESCQHAAEAQQRRALLRRYEQRLEAVVSRYEARMYALAERRS